MMTLVSVILFVVLVVAALLGRRVRRYLPENHLSADFKDAVKLAMGLVASMTALVLGLLVSSAKGTYDTVRSQVIQMTAKVAFLDRVLALYGPETADARGELRTAVTDAARRIWSTDPTVALVASAFSVAGAIFLIFELDHPFGGLIHIPSEPMINVLRQLVK